MRKLSLLFISALLIPSLGFADQITEFGLKLTPDEMRQQGYRSKTNGDFQVFERKDEKTRMKVVAEKNDYVAFIRVNSEENNAGYTKLDGTGRVLSQTHCSRVKGEKVSFKCTTQTSNFCHTLFAKMEKGTFAKLNECSSILKSIPYSSAEISSAQTQAKTVFSSAFAMAETAFASGVPEHINSLEQLLNDYAACSAVKEKLAPADSKSAGNGNSDKASSATK